MISTGCCATCTNRWRPGTIRGVGKGEDLTFMPLFKKHERNIPFRELLRTINATHREGYEP